MLKTKMYVRCPIDKDYVNPRDFLMGQITKVDTFNDSVTVKFNDPFNYMMYYDSFPKDAVLPISYVERCEFFKDTIVLYQKRKCKVIFCETGEDDFYTYYLEDVHYHDVELVNETEIIAPFSVGKVDPAVQLKKYEFQNPCWFFGRNIVSRTMNVLENSIYGFKELAGCKIFLMPHQLKTIMRCLQGDNCRYMLADEVGMGKTIEAASILKIYLCKHSEKKALIIIPEPLKEQWKTELFLKFNLIEGQNQSDNYIEVKTLGDINSDIIDDDWDFTIIDEAHRLLIEREKFDVILDLSKKTENLLLLSATPVQQKREDYLDLLRLIIPEKYQDWNQERFNELVEKQDIITKAAAMVLSNIEDFALSISEVQEGTDPHDDEECQDFYEDVVDRLEKINKIVNDEKYKELIGKISVDKKDMGLQDIKVAISYICDNYQIERNIIRNRRRCLEDLPKRELKKIEYQLDSDKNIFEYLTYQSLVNWISSENLEPDKFEEIFKPLFGAFFSSVWAFMEAIRVIRDAGIKVSQDVIENAEKWLIADEDIILNIVNILDDPEQYSSRIVSLIYYLDEFVGDNKVVLFTHYTETFEVYKNLLTEFYTENGFSCFRKGMSSDELELNVYRFQNDRNCTIMLCDETGGEGRNFQCADYVVHIDLPWDANTIEQRIGRLDRLGREKNRPVTSVVVYAEESLEEELLKFWNYGLKIFEKSLSGMEIIMKEINNAIVSAIIEDFKFGLANEIQKIIEMATKMEKSVREEQHFDTAAYLYRPMNQELMRLVKYYNQNENQLFSETMLNWAKLAGFRDVVEKESISVFNEYSFSTASAKNSLLIPPNWNVYFEQKQFLFESRVKELYANSNQKHYSNIRTIEGTFNRKTAISSDYLHFFAPGDDIFDCIVDNAMKSCRGQVASFAFKSSTEWKGLIYVWSLAPAEEALIDNDIPLFYLSPFRNYIAVDQVIIPVAFSNYSSVEERIVVSEYERIIHAGYEENKSDVEHLGKRGMSEGFLRIPSSNKVSNVEWFKALYPPERWESLVDRSREISETKARKKLMKLSHIKEAKDEIQRMLASNLSTAQFYGISENDYGRQKEIYNVVLQSLENPKLTLESASYVWMVKQ